MLLGLNSIVLEADGTEKKYNSALLIDNKGQVAGRYDKIHRVPLGEYVPLRETFPFLNRLAPYDFEYGVAEGDTITRFPLKPKKGEEREFSFGVVICYEDTVPDVARPYGGDGSHATDFLLNISNDGWFDGTSEHEEHLAICRFRAVECRRSVARTVNMGVSAVIDGNGRVLKPRSVPLPQYLNLLTGDTTAGSLAAFPWMALDMNHGFWPHVWCIPANPAEQEALPTSQWNAVQENAPACCLLPSRSTRGRASMPVAAIGCRGRAGGCSPSV